LDQRSVSKEFILAAINSGKLEFREGVIWGNPYYRILRRQLEDYIAESFGEEYVSSVKNKAELKSCKLFKDNKFEPIEVCYLFWKRMLIEYRD